MDGVRGRQTGSGEAAKRGKKALQCLTAQTPSLQNGQCVIVVVRFVQIRTRCREKSPTHLDRLDNTRTQWNTSFYGIWSQVKTTIKKTSFTLGKSEKAENRKWENNKQAKGGGKTSFQRAMPSWASFLGKMIIIHHLLVGAKSCSAAWRGRSVRLW